MKAIKKICFIVIILLASCNEHTLNKKVLDLLNRSVSQKNGQFSFGSVYNNFDSLMVLRPYSNIKKIETKFNINLSEIENVNIDFRDDIILIVFFNKRKLSEFTIIPRNRYVADIDSICMYSKKQMFNVSKRDEGTIIITD